MPTCLATCVITSLQSPHLTDVSLRLFILSSPSHFNSKHQLVLGAGALHSASRLRSISAKHLALCSHSLGLIQALVPHMRAAMACQLPRKFHVLLVEMDRVSQDYSEHHEKVSVCSDACRYTATVCSMGLYTLVTSFVGLRSLVFSLTLLVS